ncbi:hypothetical protein HK096_009870, partial [Nowakowskiella sp. JEL0078]
DQFATGLVGTRSPYGVPINPIHPEYIPGGSSSGSAVAVSAGLVDASLGTDTAGSGRVPAAFQGIVGIKPSKGLISTRGVFPACRSLDCVSVFARTLGVARDVCRVARGFDEKDAFSRRFESPVKRLNKGESIIVGIPRKEDLLWFGDHTQEAAYWLAIKKLKSEDWDFNIHFVEFDINPYLETAKLLYEGPWVSERYAVLSEFLSTAGSQKDVVNVTRKIIEGGNKYTAVDVFKSLYTLQSLKQKVEVEREKLKIDFFVVPTTPTIYTLEDVKKDNIGCNTNLGTYTNFCNLLDLCAVAMPAGKRSDGLSFGITFYGASGDDERVWDFGEEWETRQSID